MRTTTVTVLGNTTQTATHEYGHASKYSNVSTGRTTIYAKASASLLAYAGIIDKNTLLAVELAKVAKAYQSGNVAIAIDTIIMLSNGKIETTRDKKGAALLDRAVNDFATKQKNKFIVGVLCLAIVQACEMTQDDILSAPWSEQCKIHVAEFKAVFEASKPAKVAALPLAVVSEDSAPSVAPSLASVSPSVAPSYDVQMIIAAIKQGILSADDTALIFAAIEETYDIKEAA